MMIVLESDGEPYPLHTNWELYVCDYLPFQMKYDSSSWGITENENEVVFFYSDNDLMQFSYFRLYPNSGKIIVTLDDNENELGANDYFENIETVFPDASFTEFTLHGFDALEVLYPAQQIVDWYIYLENGDVLVLYIEYGEGPMRFRHTQYLKAMLSTFEYREIALAEDYSVLLSEIFEIVLVENMGMSMLEQLPDKTIIETDTIGVGTGPVDYYYSEGVDYTFKYERSSDVILDTREGQTTAF